MASDLVRFSVTMPEGLLREFDDYTAGRGTNANRSEVIRDLVRERLVEERLDVPDEEVIGSITMVYDHHTPDLTARLDEIQHGYTTTIVSSMHVHLDHHNCLEIIAVRGIGKDVHELADRLLGVKGVRHGRLTCVATQSSMDGGISGVHAHQEVCGG